MIDQVLLETKCYTPYNELCFICINHISQYEAEANLNFEFVVIFMSNQLLIACYLIVTVYFCPRHPAALKLPLTKKNCLKVPNFMHKSTQ